MASVFCHTEELLYHYYLYSFNLFISRTALSESTTYGKFVLHLRRVQQCWMSQHPDRCLLQYVVCALPNVRHASRCSRLVSWVTTTAVTIVVLDNFLTKESLCETTSALLLRVLNCFTRIASSEGTTYGIHLCFTYVEYNSVGCLSTRTAVFYSKLFVLYPMYVMQVVVLV